MWTNCGFVEYLKTFNKNKIYKNTKKVKIYKNNQTIHKGCKHVDKAVYNTVYKRG